MFENRYLRVARRRDNQCKPLLVYSRKRRDENTQPVEEEIEEIEGIEEETELSAPKKLQYFFSQPGRSVIGPRVRVKGARREPSLRLEENNLDWLEKPSFYHDMCRNVENKFESIAMEHITMEHLFAQRNLIFTGKSMATISRSTKVFDANNCPLLYYCKGALKWPFLKGFDPVEEGERALNKLVSDYPPPKPKATDARHKGVVHQDGHGVYHLGLWHARGHGYCLEEKDNATNGGVLSADIAAVSARKMNTVAQFHAEFSLVSQAVGAVFHIIDQKSYTRFHGIYHAIADRSALGWLRTTTRNCFMGMAILSGLCCKPHRYDNDMPDGWAADLAFGDFQGGNLEVPQLGLQFNLRPGDVISIRSALLQHSVSKVTAGHRFGVVYFNHRSMMEHGLGENLVVV